MVKALAPEFYEHLRWLDGAARNDPRPAASCEAEGMLNKDTPKCFKR